MCHHIRCLQYKHSTSSGLFQNCVVTAQENVERLVAKRSKPTENPSEAFENPSKAFRSLSKAFQTPSQNATSCSRTEKTLQPYYLSRLQLSKNQKTPYGIKLVQVRRQNSIFAQWSEPTSLRSDALAGLPMSFDTRSKVISVKRLESYMLDPLRESHHACSTYLFVRYH